jgi:hypothetical protein
VRWIVALVLALALTVATGANAATRTGADAHDRALAQKLLREMYAIYNAQIAPLRGARGNRFLAARMTACPSLLKRALASDVASGDLDSLGTVELIRDHEALYTHFDRTVARGHPDAEVFRTWAARRVADHAPYWALVRRLPRTFDYCKLARVALAKGTLAGFRALGVYKVVFYFSYANQRSFLWERNFELFLLESGFSGDDASTLSDF